MSDERSEHGRRSNAWRYGEGTMWGQTEVWVTGGGDVIPVEELIPSGCSSLGSAPRFPPVPRGRAVPGSCRPSTIEGAIGSVRAFVGGHSDARST